MTNQKFRQGTDAKSNFMLEITTLLTSTHQDDIALLRRSQICIEKDIDGAMTSSERGVGASAFGNAKRLRLPSQAMFLRLGQKWADALYNGTDVSLDQLVRVSCSKVAQKSLQA